MSYRTAIAKLYRIRSTQISGSNGIRIHVTAHVKDECFGFIFVVSFALVGPDPDSGSGYRSTDLILSGSNSDPDPKHC
jgi:hypothetical protein